jgi:NSS family neurotransmitter:Na+ symporter
MTTSGTPQWSSRTAFVLAAVGCAVGLGNIWLFPYTAGANGGGAFVLVYLGAVVVLALPVLMAELMIGRRGAAAPPAAIAAVAAESGHSRNWRWMGILLGGIGAILALAFYAVVGGWTMAYVFKMATGQLQQIDAAQSKVIFDQLNSEPGSLLPWFTAFFAATIFISARGVQSGIEKAVKFMMPALFLMLVAMVIYAASVGDFSRAVRFLFNPDFSKIDSQVVLRAFGQAFFTVSVGITNMMAYGAYLQRDTRLPRVSAVIVGADTLVALLAGLAIFPIIFQYGLEPGAGEGLVFMTLPIAFGQVPGGLVFGTVFFVLLLFAALTSSIGMLEPPVSWLRDTTNLKRLSAALLAGSIAFVLGLLAALSFSVLSDFQPLGGIALFENMRFFEVFIYLVTSVLMPFGGLVLTVFAGWLIKKQFSRDELFEGRDSFLYRAWLIIVRFVAPAILAFVLFDVATG